MIELLVVITIISVLAALLLPAVSAAKESANSVKCMSNLRQIGLAFTMYGEQWGVYPYAYEDASTAPVTGAQWMTRITPFLTQYGKPYDMWTFGWNRLSPVLDCPNRPVKATLSTRWSYSVSRQFLADKWSGAQYPRRYPYVTRPQETLLCADCSMRSDGGCSSSFSFPVELKSAYDPTTANNPVSLPDNTEVVYGGTDGNLTFRHKGRSRCNMVFVDGHVESMHITQLQERHLKIDAPVTGW